MSSQWGSQNLLQGLVSHELKAYLSIFNLFKLNELWPYYQKHVNQIILNRTTLWSLALRIFEAFVQILLIVNLSLNQTLLTFLLYVRQNCMTQLILAILCEGLSSFNPKWFYYSCAWSCSLCEGLQELSLENSTHSYLFSAGFTSLCLTSFSSINHLSRLYAHFWILFHLT